MAVEVPQSAWVETNRTLTQAMIWYTRRDDAEFVRAIPMLIAVAQYRIALELKLTANQTYFEGSLVPHQQSIAKPNRWRADVSANIGTGPTLTKRTPVFQREYEYAIACFPTETDYGQPQYYDPTYEQSKYYFFPTPDQAYPFRIQYWQTPELLSPSTAVNTYTQNYPRLVLWAALAETAPFLQNDPRIAMWEAKYKEDKISVGVEEDLKVLGMTFDSSAPEGVAA